MLPELRALIADREAWEPPDGESPDPDVPADAPCLLRYSSGTTGRPKGVVHTHANLASRLLSLFSRGCKM